MSVDVTQADVDAAKAACRAAGDANMAAQATALTALQAYIAANREVIRLEALSTPLRECLLGWFDGTVIHRRPMRLAKIAERTYRDQADVEAARTELVAEGLIVQVGNGYLPPEVAS